MARKKPGEEALVIILAGAALLIGHTQGLFNLREFWDSLFGGGTTTTPPPGTTPPPSGGTVPAGTVLYDSNENGWANTRTAASGNPQFEAGADGVGRLSCDADSHGRIYIDVPNYNAVMTGQFMFESGFNDRDNFSLRLRSRHADCGGSGNVFGGFGSSIHINGEVGFETEICHNEHENSIDGNLPFTPVMGQWYQFAFYAVDSADKSSVNFRMDIDGQTVHTGSHTSPAAEYLDEATFMQESSIWLRMNNATQDAVLAFKDFKLISQEPGSLDGQTSSSSGRVRSYATRHMDNYYLYNKGPAGLYT